MYRTVQYIGANLAVVVLQISAGPVIDDTGINRTGAFVATVGVVLLVGVLVSRSIRELPAVTSSIVSRPSISAHETSASRVTSRATGRSGSRRLPARQHQV